MKAWPRLWGFNGLWALALALATHGVSWANVWAFVDEKGVAHFASSPLDERYQLFARVEAAPPIAAVETATAPAPPTLDPTPNVPGKARDRLMALLERSPDYQWARPLLEQAAQRHNVDIHLLVALTSAESGFDRKAVSPKGAVGLMQLMPATAQRFGVTARKGQGMALLLTDPVINIEAGTRYLKYLQGLYPGQPELALAAYNAGEGAVAKAGGKIPNYPETQNYVKTVTQLHRLIAGPVVQNNAVAWADTSAPMAVAPAAKAIHMMVPGVVPGRSNMVPPITVQDRTLPLPLSASPPSASTQ